MNSAFILLLAASAVFGQALQNTTITPDVDGDKCLEVTGGVFANGTPVQINDCNSTSAAQIWTLQAGSTAVMVAGTNFCLDAGSTPASGEALKIWQCYSGLAAQQWYRTDDARIALDGQGLCLDLPNGSTADGTQVQTWTCTDGNENQVWNLPGVPAPPTPPTSDVVQIHPNGDASKCLDIRAASYVDGTAVQVYDCNGTPAQNWVIERGSTSVKANGTNFCLDAGSSPANGVQMKIWDCYDGLAAQEWYYTDDNRIALENQGFCLDLPNGDVTNENQVQIWQCTTDDTFQVWTI